MIQDLSSVILGISDNLRESNRQTIFNRPAGRCDHCPAAPPHKSTIKSHENHEMMWTNCEINRNVREISTKMQRKLEKRKRNEPYKKKNVQNLKEWEKHRRAWRSRRVSVHFFEKNAKYAIGLHTFLHKYLQKHPQSIDNPRFLKKAKITFVYKGGNYMTKVPSLRSFCPFRRRRFSLN